MTKTGAFTLLLFHTITFCFTQISFLDYNPNRFHTFDRISAIHPKYFLPHTAIRYTDPLVYVDLLDSLSIFSISDQEQLKKFIGEYDEINPYIKINKREDTKNGSGFWGAFYSVPYHLYRVSTDDFELRVNPIINIQGGSSSGNAIYQNTRGLKIKGSIDRKIYFYSTIYENQREFLPFVNQRINRWGAIPGQGFYKGYQSNILTSFNGWDYLNAQAYTGLKISKSIDLQLGFGNNFIGDGHRSLLLSDYSHNYLYLKLNTNVWKFHYQNLFTELAPISSTQSEGDKLLPKKYMVAHYLDFKPSSRISIGLYEAVVFSRNNQFEIQYINPVILYKTIEQFLDSPDNVLIGLNLSYVPVDGTKLYGQLMLDEFRSDQIFAGNGWWGNKIAYQLGVKHYDLFNIDRLDLQLEYNTARPYTYSHRVTDETGNVLTSYSHFNQALAHPLGANFNEIIFEIKYQPSSDVRLSTKILKSNYGDSITENIGFDFLLNNETRAENFGNFTGQGIPIEVTLLDLGISYELFPGYYAELRYLYRNQTSETATLNDKTSYISLGVSVNMFNKRIDY